MAGHSRRLAPINRGAVNGTACHFCRRTARPTLMLGRDARARRFCRPGHWNSTGSRLAPCNGADYRCRTRPTCSTKATQSHGRSRRGAAALRRARGKMPSSRRCREVFAARQDDIEKVITGAEHGQPAARQQGVAVAQPLRFAVRGEKCLRGRCREVFAARLYKPISFPKPLLAVLVYRLVCQPVTLESWVRLPDAALDSDRAPALNSGRNKHRQTAGKHARNHFSAGPIVSFARSVVIIHLSFLRSAESITKHKLFEPGRRTR